MVSKKNNGLSISKLHYRY